MLDFVLPGPDNQINLESVLFSSQNESHDTWSGICELSSSCLGEMKSDRGLVDDRMRGLPRVVQHWYPDINTFHCHKHLKANMQLNGARHKDLLRWRKAALNVDPGRGGFQCDLTDFINECPQRLRNYYEVSIASGNSSPKMWASSQCNNEREGMYTTQLSESLHRAIKGKGNVRSFPLIYGAEAMFVRELKKMKDFYVRYLELSDNGKILPRNREIEWHARCRHARHYRIELGRYGLIIGA